MRHRVRRLSYVDRVVEQRARDHALVHGLTNSAVTEAALIKYLDGDGVDEALVVRRMDGVAQGVAQVRHDLNVLAVAFGEYAGYSFRSAPAPAATPEAHQRAESINRQFLRHVCERLNGGVTFPREVLQSGPKPPPRPGKSSDGDGGKGGGGK